MIRPALRSALRPAIKGSLRGASRYFTELDQLAQSYIATSSDVLLDSDFSARFKFALPSIPDTTYSCGNSGNFNNRIAVFSSGNGDVRFASGDVLTVSGEPFSPFWGKLIEVELTRSGDNISLSLNGNEIGSSTVSGSDFIAINQFGRNSTSVRPPKNYEQIMISDSSGLLLSYNVDANYTPANNTVLDLSGSGNHGTFVSVADGDSKLYSLRSDDNWEGEDIVTQDIWENPDSVSGWVYNSSVGAWSLAGDGSNQSLTLIPSSLQPLPLIIDCNVISVDGAGLLFSSTTDVPPATTTGLNTRVISADVGGFQVFKRRSGIVNAQISKPTIKPFLEVTY